MKLLYRVKKYATLKILWRILLIFNQISGHGAYEENGVIYASLAGIVQKADK